MVYLRPSFELLSGILFSCLLLILVIQQCRITGDQKNHAVVDQPESLVDMQVARGLCVEPEVVGQGETDHLHGDHYLDKEFQWTAGELLSLASLSYMHLG